MKLFFDLHDFLSGYCLIYVNMGSVSLVRTCIWILSMDLPARDFSLLRRFCTTIWWWCVCSPICASTWVWGPYWCMRSFAITFGVVASSCTITSCRWTRPEWFKWWVGQKVFFKKLANGTIWLKVVMSSLRLPRNIGKLAKKYSKEEFSTHMYHLYF